MKRMRHHLFLAFACLLLVATARAEYLLRAERIADEVYAIVGPLGQRSRENEGLNANYAFIVTPAGVILIDSGASRLGAQKLEKAIQAITDKPVRWVINTDSQDHRWLGNDYFFGRGAEIIAMKRTAATQGQYARQQLEGLQRFLGERLADTQAKTASRLIEGETAALDLAGEAIKLHYTDAHYPGDAMVYLPRQGIVMSGDLVYVDRLLGVLPGSSVRNEQKAFRNLANYESLHRSNMNRAFVEFEKFE